jgi:hypothetical protein
MTKAEILAAVNATTRRELTDIDTYLIHVLVEISRRTLSLKEELEGTTTADQNYITAPDDLAGSAIDGLIIDGYEYDPAPLRDVLNGRNRSYCLYNSKIYVYPTPDGESYTLRYAKLHPSSADTILFPEIYREVIEHGVKAKVYEQYEIMDKLADQISLYEAKLAKLIGDNATPPVCRPHRGV